MQGAASYVAGAAAAAADERDAARADELRVERDVLAAFVAVVRPGLRLAAKRPRVALVGDRARAASWSGVSCGGSGLERGGGIDDTRGRYVGEALWLRLDGTFIRLTYSGAWTRWQGEADEWEARERELSVDYVVARYDVERIVGYVRDVLAAATAAAPRETAAARARAAKLAAALDVLLAR